MSYDHSNIESLEKPDENGNVNGGRPISPGNLRLDDYDGNERTSLYSSDIIPDKDIAIRDDSYYDKSSKNTSSFDTTREEKIDAKDDELLERENLIQDVKLNNWPWFYPVVYHNIAKEIPEEFQVHTRRLYHICLATWGTMFWNWLVMTVAFFGGYGAGIMDFI